VTPDQERRAHDLMRQALDGEQTAYAELLAQLGSTARGYVRLRLGPVAWLDDVVQETLLAVHVSRHSYDRRRPFAPWFYAILKSRLIDALRKQRRIAGREAAEASASEPSTRAAAGHDEIDVEAIRQALRQLPERQRHVIEALKYRDESVRDVARRLGLTESAVKVTAHRGYRALKRLLGGK
jgi:RNA polymerase sigma-70 factor (ECF subfamily)